MSAIRIDPEFRDLLPPLSAEQFNVLENKIQLEGFRDSLIVWRGKGILVDGHNRLKICEKHGIKYTVTYIHFHDRAEVIAWIKSHQAARRNMTDKEIAYFLGKKLLTKIAEGGKGNKAEEVAKEHGVSRATAERSAEFATAVDKKAQTPEEKDTILKNDLPMNKIKEEAFKKKIKGGKGHKRIKSGKESFDWLSYERALGEVTRGCDRIADAYPAEKGGPEYHQAIRLMREYHVFWKNWRKKILKENKDGESQTG